MAIKAIKESVKKEGSQTVKKEERQTVKKEGCQTVKKEERQTVKKEGCQTVKKEERQTVKKEESVKKESDSTERGHIGSKERSTLDSKKERQ